jgi:DNA-binding response OmpR family regulator
MVPVKRIMLVKDEDGIRDLLYELLVDAGFEIVQAATADAAFRLLERETFSAMLEKMTVLGQAPNLRCFRWLRWAITWLTCIGLRMAASPRTVRGDWQ